MRIFNYIFLLTLLTTFPFSIHSQNLIITETGHTVDGCVSSVNLDYKISDRRATYYLTIYKQRDGYNILDMVVTLRNKPVGTYTYGNIDINERTIIKLEKRFFTTRRLISTKSIYHCLDDYDSDGFLNEDDSCPYDYGGNENYGCPGNPDLAVNEELSKQISSCYSCNSTFEDINGRPSIYRYGGNITLKSLVIENIGDGRFGGTINGACYIKFYLSKDDKLDLDKLNEEGEDIGFSVRTKSLGSFPNPGDTVSLDVSIEGSDIGDRVPYGDYYLVIQIDSDDVIGDREINKDNNIYFLPVKYTGTLPSNKSIVKSLNDKIENETNQYYKLDIFNFLGRLIKSVKVNSAVQENSVIDGLPSGLYILKTPSEIRKIVK